jgi:hypothetical protein
MTAGLPNGKTDPLRRRKNGCFGTVKRGTQMADVQMADSIQPCDGCGSKKFSLIFRDGSSLPERQANERCDGCGEERPSDGVPRI